MFDPITKLLLGLGAGVVFGFLLQKGQVSKYRVIVGQFLLRDFTMLKVVLSAIVVGSFGVLALQNAGLASAHIKPAALAAIGVGGLLFGVGMAVLGYCPGTGVAAVAEGSRHAIFGVLGMFAGAAVYAEVYASITDNLLVWGNYGKITLAEITGVSAWLYLVALAIAAFAAFIMIQRHERSGGRKNDERPSALPKEQNARPQAVKRATP